MIVSERGIGRDVEFRVHVLGGRRFAIADARWVGVQRRRAEQGAAT
jgi:hypothetical protein